MKPVRLACLALALAGAQATAQTETAPDTAAAPSSECPADAVQRVAQIGQHFATTDTIAEDAFRLTNAYEAACPENMLVQLEIANAWNLLLQRGGIDPGQKMQIANKAIGVLAASDKLELVAHNYSAAGALRKSVVQTAVSLVDAGADPAPYFVPGATFPSCDYHWTNVSQVLWYSYRKEWTGTARPAFIENLAETCAGETFGAMHQYHGDLLSARAERETDPLRAFEIIQEARKAYLNTSRDGETMRVPGTGEAEFLVLYDWLKLKALRADPPLADPAWFSADSMADGTGRSAIAAVLNEIWGPFYTTERDRATKEQVTMQLLAYTAFLRSAFETAVATHPEARGFLHGVLKAHAEGELRTEKTQFYPGPSDYIWSWVDPAAGEMTFSEE